MCILHIMARYRVSSYQDVIYCKLNIKHKLKHYTVNARRQIKLEETTSIL